MTDAANLPESLAPESRALKHRRQAAWRERNPQSTWAHMALRSGLRRGLVTPQPCEVCGEPKAEAHHPDYDRPLDVVWLCRPHHKAEHARENAAHGQAADPAQASQERAA